MLTNRRQFFARDQIRMSACLPPAALAGVLSCLVACGQEPAVAPAGNPSAITPEAARGPANRAVFKDPELLIASLETPTPVRIFGKLNQETVRTDDASIASVADNGTVVGHKAGETRLHGSNGSTLHVVVRSDVALTIQPERSEFQPRDVVRVAALAGDAPVPAHQLTWITSNPRVAWIDGDWIHAGIEVGEATLTARFGALSATTTVRTKPKNLGPRSLAGAARMRVQEVQRMNLLPTMDPQAVWTSSKPKVLAELGQGFFQAQGAGMSEVCVTFPHSVERLCNTVEVVR